MSYKLNLVDSTDWDHVISIEGEDPPNRSKIREVVEEWVNEGDWGVYGASVTVWWDLEDEDGQEMDSGRLVIDIEADHCALIRRATSGCSRSCGDDPEDHDWTSEGEGGLRENPGVWSVGGTGLVFRSHCRDCGLSRREYTPGSQRNPGESDEVEYRMPGNWCSDCESETCECSDE